MDTARTPKIIYRVIPPHIDRPVDILGDPVNDALVDRRNDVVSRPHDLYVFREPADALQIVDRCLTATVLSVILRAENDRFDITLGLDVLTIYPRDKIYELIIVCCGVIKEDGELPDADSVVG